MPLQAIDVQTNIANIGKLAKENNTQLLVDRGQIHGQAELSLHGRLVQSRIFSMKELSETDHTREFKNNEEAERRKMRKRQEEALQDKNERSRYKQQRQISNIEKGKIFDWNG